MHRLSLTWKLGFTLAAVNLGFLSFWAADLALDLSSFFNAGTLDWFDPNKEGNLAVWYSTSLLVLVSVAAFINFSLDSVCTETSSSRWRFAWLGIGLITLFLSFEEVSQLHESIQYMFRAQISRGGWIGKGGRAWLIPYMPFVLIAIAGFCLTFRHMFQERRAPFRLATGGIALWVCALILEFFAMESFQLGYYRIEIIIEEGAEILGTSALLLACVWYGEERWRELVPSFATEVAERNLDVPKTSIGQLPATSWLALSLLTINSLLALFWIIGLYYGISVFPVQFTRLISPFLEENFTTWYSGLLLILAAVAAAANSYLDAKTTGDTARPLAWLGLCALTFFLSLDELAQIHEKVAASVQHALAGRGAGEWIATRGRAWLIPYLPFILVAVVGMLAIFRRLFQYRAVLHGLALGGVCLWLCSLILVFFSSDIRQWGPWYFSVASVLEESAEILGSSILLIIFVWYGEERVRQVMREGRVRTLQSK